MLTAKWDVAAWMLAAAILLAHAAPGDEADPTSKKQKGPLAALPSQPGPHIEKIKALGDNEWLHLGSPVADPKWGRARGRSWSSNMPAAANLGGAFVFAEGVHGYVKPDGHYMNDLWFYDISANRWMCLYPGIEVKTITQRIKEKELTVDDHGVIVDKSGEPLPPLLIHAYGYLGYDPELRKFVTFGGQFANYFTTGEGAVFEQANKLFQEQRKGKELPELSPFYYDVASGRWECLAVKDAPKGQPYGANILVYVASRKQFCYGGSDGVWFLDRDKRTWLDAKPEGTPPEGIDHCADYDPRRDRIYHFTQNGKTAGDNFFIYDIKSNAWSKPQPKGAAPFYASAYESIFNLDAANDKLVIIRLYQTKDEPGYRRGVYVYDPESNAWADPLPLPAEVVKSIKNGNYGWYDSQLNAYFCHFASDSNDDGTMWAYRYK
jgi:hypothetical protein